MTLEEDLIPLTFLVAVPAAVAGAAFAFAAFSTLRRLGATASAEVVSLVATLRSRERAPLAPRKSPNLVCPYCKDAIVEEGVRVECAECATWHHPICFEENLGCAVYGCRERRGHGISRRVR